MENTYTDYQTDTDEQIVEYLFSTLTDEEKDQYRRDLAIERTLQKSLSKGFKIYNLNAQENRR